MRFFTLALFLLSVSAFADIEGRVVAVTAGDIITVFDSQGTEHKIQLKGVDAPERGQPHSETSRKHLSGLVSGQQVRVESPPSDRHGQVVGKVWVRPADCPTCGQTLDVNLAQITAGMAWWYRYHREEQSPSDRGRYESAEDEAKARGWGLWSDPNPINPSDWRIGIR